MNISQHGHVGGGVARALWFVSAGAAEIRSEGLPLTDTDSALVRMCYSGISRGTEALVFQGRVPESERERMRGPNMAGMFSFPVKYGYCAVGRVEKGPEALLGRMVFCLHPHQDRFVVPAAMLAPLPDNISPARAVLAANMETALNIIWDAAVQPGDQVVVYGAGVVGALVAFLANAIPGTDVLLVDANPARAALAKTLGIAFGDGNMADGFDVAINASGSGEALGDAMKHAGQEARIVEASWHGDRNVSLPLGGPFHARRLSLISSQVGAVPAGRRARWPFSRRMAKALALLADDRLDALISGETDFPALASRYAAILADPATLCHRIVY
ncbi:zinc-binding alcohol dehydrogenase [Martelella alba]|uniref:Zinc-binding alcohol dehydrogenase n=1 Tax=Martelella alba TaxID=2590451 RepID=A0A506U465_9HYPH|nr:zinc-binding alcohol dehydrogenase [Martelella alba]TPW27805.1 zinc-binding alcohol dehydrogenase [Martelella alba]